MSDQPFLTGMPPLRDLGLVVNPNKPRALAKARTLAAWLEGQGCTPKVPWFLAGRTEPDNPRSLDYLEGSQALVVLGGDGTLLAASRFGAPRALPMLSIRFGGFGFLAEAEPQEAQRAVASLLEGRYGLEERILLSTHLHRDGIVTCCGLALNDVVITRGALSRVVLLRTETQDGLVSVYSADGVIVSTPTGSTAYSLSAGGPLVHPGLAVLLVTPICPHSLNARTVVLPDSSGVRLTLESSDEAMLTIDGQVGLPVQTGDVIQICRSETPARLITFGHESFFDRLQSRLRWGDRFRQ
ncbi:MAG TPA: NAD(+)/NADH kinase [Armatimonadota bacterium]|jgi:NAD+ kinase